MNTICQPCACTLLPPGKSDTRLQRWVTVVRHLGTSLMTIRRRRLSESQLTALDGLSAETLKDIGAPEWLQEQVYRSHERARQGGLLERDSLHWR